MEARQYKMQLSELQNELRVERMQRDTQAVSLHDTQGRLHAADAAELASLRQQRDETARARAEAGQQFIELAQEREQDRVEKVRLEEQVRAAHSLSGDWLAEQNLQLRQITQLQLVQAELQTELARKEEQLDAARLHPLHPTMHLLHLLHPRSPCIPCTPPPPANMLYMPALLHALPSCPVQMRQGIYPVPGASSGGAGAAYSPALYAPPQPLAAAALAAATAPRAPSPPPRRARAPPPLAPTTSTPPSRSLLGMLGFGGGGGGGGGEREAELNEQLESKDSANLALQVQLANLKGALRSQEEMTRGLMLQNAHSPGGDNGPLSARGHLLIKHQNQNDPGWGFG